jgi:Ca2+/Na+ antiporter
LLGLGLPWLVYCLQKEKEYEVNADGIGEAVFILFLTVLLFAAALKVNQWKMTQALGKALLGLYGLYIVYTIASI